MSLQILDLIASSGFPFGTNVRKLQYIKKKTKQKMNTTGLGCHRKSLLKRFVAKGRKL